MRTDPAYTEPIESEIRTNVPLLPYSMRRDGKTYTVMARVPERCRRAFGCLAGDYMGREPRHVRLNGSWRYIDIVVTTDHQCDDRKLRELVELNPGLIDVREHKGHSGNSYNTYRLIIDGQPGLF